MQYSEEVDNRSESAPHRSGEEESDSSSELKAAVSGESFETAGEPAPESFEASEEEQVSTLLLLEDSTGQQASEDPRNTLKAVIEAAIYITDEPLTADQIASAIDQPIESVREILAHLVREYSQPDRGLTIRELAGGYKMGTKPEHHEHIRQFVKKLQPPLKLSLPALETLAVVAYKQPITAPEIMEIRGVQGAGVLKTLLDRKLVATAGRKDVIGKPIMYKTTKEFLIQFGLSSLKELPTLKEFEELGRLALSDEAFPEPPRPAESSGDAADEQQSTAAQGPEHERSETASDG